MFSKTSYKQFRHKAKKGMMKRIGKVESRPEDPNFKAILSAMVKLKLELKEFQFQTNAAAQAGKTYNNSVENFCGSGIKGEALYNKEDLFISTLQECFAPTLDNLVTIEIPKMEELVVAYKTAKLKFDSSYFQTVKDMRKKEIGGSDVFEEVMKNNANLTSYQQSYFDSKREIINQQNVLKGRLENEVSNALSEVQRASNAEHHQLYIDFMMKRVSKTASICNGTAVIEQTVNKQRQLEQKGDDDGIERGEDDEKVNIAEAVVEEEAVVIEEVNSSNLAVNSAEAPSAEVEKGSIEENKQPDFAVEKDIPDLEDDEEDVPQPPSRKAPEVPQEQISSPQGVLQPPPPPVGNSET